MNNFQKKRMLFTFCFYEVKQKERRERAGSYYVAIFFGTTMSLCSVIVRVCKNWKKSFRNWNKRFENCPVWDYSPIRTRIFILAAYSFCQSDGPPSLHRDRFIGASYKRLESSQRICQSRRKKQLLLRLQKLFKFS